MGLKHIRIQRKPHSASAKQFESAADTVEMYTEYSDSKRQQLFLAFTTWASGGQGFTPPRTDYRVLIDVEEYASIIKAMCDVDEDSALSAMADELATRLRRDPS